VRLELSCANTDVGYIFHALMFGDPGADLNGDWQSHTSAAPSVGDRRRLCLRNDARGAAFRKTQIPAFDRLSWEILPGEIFCFLGLDGAGKSTSVTALTTWVRPKDHRSDDHTEHEPNVLLIDGAT